MTRSGAELFVEALETYGVSYLFGNPGTTEVPVMNALGDSTIEYVLGLQEDISVGMAAGYACTRRQRGEDLPVGVVNLHVAPGMAHGLGNLYAASVSGAPMVVTAGAHGTDHQHEEPILHGNLVEMTQQYTKWSEEVKHVDALPTMLRRAFKVALSPPMGPVFLALPIDVMTATTDKEIEPLGSVPSIGRGNPHEIARAVDALVEADEPVLIVGDQIARRGQQAVETIVSLAEIAGTRVHSEILSTEVNFPMDHPQWVSHMPESFEEARHLHETDTVILIGCSTHTPTLAHDEPLVPVDATTIQVGEDPWEIGKNGSSDVSIVGDILPVVDDIVRGVNGRVTEEVLEHRLAAIEDIRSWVNNNLQQQTLSDTEEITKPELVNAIREEVPDAYIVDESVTTRYALLSEWPLQPGQLFGNKSGGLGYGLSAAIGAALAENEQPVIGLLGDGSYLYYPHAIYSAIRHNIDLTIVVSDNRNYRILKDNTLKILGGTDEDHEFIGMDFDPAVDIATNAASQGAKSKQITELDQFRSSLQDAIGSNEATVLDVHVTD